jgi:ketosteroid isomerase-like protein
MMNDEIRTTLIRMGRVFPTFIIPHSSFTTSTMMSFEEFLTAYQEACSRGDTRAIMPHVAEDYRGDYVYPAGNMRAFDKEALEAGWRAAEENFAAAGARWAFENVAMGRREDERIVASWVSFLVEGQPTGRSFLVATFRQTPSGWKLTREHMQHRVDPVKG